MASNMNAMSEAMQGEFMALLFAYCLAPQDHDLSKIASEFAAKHNMNLKPLKKTIQHTFELVSHAVQENLSPRDFIEQLSRAGMELAPAKLFASHWETHRPALLQRVHQALVMSTSFVKLTWKLGITAATNHMPELGTVFVQLSFHMDKGKPELETETIELSVDNFYLFLANMEALHAHMLFLKR
ncbi:hypothetical protein LEN26_000336 [Aphanomyces euteiches]|nr:hypothetical protein AeMF1_021436 [Aphanomyces euteiches]KAH9163762.1 hypothetical protein LEN26_000336 [Aphanomyces euteiches]KAH9187961.1 hypothetical protein AeNC1_010063 [Aphanomyces euteiches]